MTVGVLINPKSGKRNEKGLELFGKLQNVAGVGVRLMNHFEELPAILAEFAKQGTAAVYISSGDGTIQGVQTILAEARLFPDLPRLCLLPHGTTNMTASNFGCRLRSLDAQAALIRSGTATETLSRPTLRAVNPQDGRPRHGMFLGTGAVTQAVRFCQDAVHGTGLKGDFATAATLLAAIAGAVVGRGDPGDLGRITRPHDIKVSVANRTRASGQQLLLTMTTLDKLILGAQPFWGGKTAPLRITVFPYPVPNLLRWIIPAMYGREDRKAPPGAVSFCSAECEITTSSDFIMDGEFFGPPADAPLKVETGPSFTYIRA